MKTRALVYYFEWSFVLHLIWENVQAPLFEGYTSLRQHFLVCLYGTATGDMFFMAVIYLVLVAVHRDGWWVAHKECYGHVATWIIPVVVGILLAVSFELWAVYVAHRWVYGVMPLVPIIGVGVMPVLQMIFVPLATIALVRRMSKT